MAKINWDWIMGSVQHQKENLFGVLRGILVDLTALKGRNDNNITDLTSARTAINNLANRIDSFMITSAGLVIKAAASALVKTGASACYALASGRLRSIAAATDMAALAGTVVNATFNVYCFFVDSAGNLTSAMGTAGASLAAVTFPAIPTGKALIGCVIINPTGTGNFVGGTTALDDATVVPGALYVNFTGTLDPAAPVMAALTTTAVTLETT